MSGMPDKEWWTAAEIAEAGLLDLPITVQGVNRLARDQDWRASGHARTGVGRGGGWEYHWSLFPARAQRKLLRDAAPIEDAPVQLDHDSFEALPDKSKNKAKHRLRVLQAIEAIMATGRTKEAALSTVAASEHITERSIWNWFKLVDCVDRTDWLYCLTPRHGLAKRRDKKAECSPEFMDRLKADYLRLEAPPFSTSYRLAVRLADAKGWEVLPERTARRRLNAEVPRVTRVFAREGSVGLERCFPPQTRDRTGMTALEGVNADCHKFDVFVEWPDGKVDRPQIVAFQDIYSGKMLSWRIDHTPNSVAVMSAFGDMIDDYGIPQRCLFDNGREFANKWLTAGAKTRFRFKIREDDPLGVLPLLGIQLHWATPGHGQAKPIERAFRDFASDIAKDPRFAGAYVGNRPDAKPENYKSHAVPIEDFLRVITDGIEEHNARAGRISETTSGRSFNETFATSYANAPIRKATAEQRRLWLMGQEVLTLHRSHGLVKLHGNEYWSDWMNESAGQQVVVRFDPENLHDGVYIYAKDGSFMGFADCKAKVGFFDLTGAQEHARRKSSIRRAEKRLRDKAQPLPVRILAEELNALADPVDADLVAKVVKPEFGKTKRAAPLVERPVYEDRTSPDDAANLANFEAKFKAEQQRREKAEREEEPIELFKRAIDLERRAAAGLPIGHAEADWLYGYQQTGEYRGQRRMYEDFGDAMFQK